MPPPAHGPHGTVEQPDGSIAFRVWAPNHPSVELLLFDGDRVRPVEMNSGPHGYFSATIPDVPDGQRYLYRLPGGAERPDPASRSQPDGPHGPSAVVRTSRFRWTDHGWKGLRREDLVIYELHVGTFTPDGTFDAVVPRLGELKELGVTAVEVMPVAQFPGTRNWGYDGVCPFAVQNSYGGPAGLQRLADAAHAAGLGVILDVVYNHLGPDGNYLREFGPYFADRYRTPWGDALNYDGPDSDPVRDYVVQNARAWLADFHLDGLRLDAVHAIYDLGPVHVLKELQDAADAVAARRGWPAHVVAESDLNDPKLLLPPDRGGYGLNAQWADDFHHAVHAFLTGERHGYYAEYGAAEDLAGVLAEPFLRPGVYSSYRRRRHGARPAGLTGDRFVVCVQNHDQIGNRARGDRLAALVGPNGQRLAACLLLLSPHLPLIFMGEEYGETNPFPFFCSFESAELAEAVRKGRREEFAAFGWRDDVPDPQAEETFRSAVLSWRWDDPHRGGMRKLYASLLAARRAWPALRDFRDRSVRLTADGGVLELVRGGRSASPGRTLTAYFNLTAGPAPLPSPADGEAVLFRSGDGGRHLGPFECVAVGPSGWPRA